MKLMILDGNSIVNRAYYGIRPLTNKEGLYTHAIYGYLNMFAYYRFGKAAAISVLFFIVVMAIGCGFLKVKSKVEVEY